MYLLYIEHSVGGISRSQVMIVGHDIYYKIASYLYSFAAPAATPKKPVAKKPAKKAGECHAHTTWFIYWQVTVYQHGRPTSLYPRPIIRVTVIWSQVSPPHRLRFFCKLDQSICFTNEIFRCSKLFGRNGFWVEFEKFRSFCDSFHV